MEALILTVLLTSVPLIFAATGELVAERSGVLNLGVEGMMLMGAVSAFAATSIFGNPYMGIIAGALAGAMTAAVFSLFALALYLESIYIGFMGCIILAREFWVSALRDLNARSGNPVATKVTFLAKIKTTTQLFTISIYLFGLAINISLVESVIF